MSLIITKGPYKKGHFFCQTKSNKKGRREYLKLFLGFNNLEGKKLEIN
jgi:hypothetical protein